MSGLTWLASYPKSGNTWMRLALESLRRDGKAIDINHDSPDRPGGAAPRLEFDERLGVASSDLLCDEQEVLRPRLYEAMALDGAEILPLKVHDAWTFTSADEPLFPPSATAGAIYLIRDPRDVAVSLAHHLGRTIDVTIALMADRDTIFGQETDRKFSSQLRQRLLDWSGHVLSWTEAPIRRHIVRYEDMLADPAAAFAAVAHFIGRPASTAAIAGAVAATRFEALRSQEEEHGFIERSRRADRFFRAGVAGDWAQCLTPEQARRIERDHAAVMARFGYL